ncbi:hypothetical protein, partial, partial [Parasitella parasitica]
MCQSEENTVSILLSVMKLCKLCHRADHFRYSINVVIARCSTTSQHLLQIYAYFVINTMHHYAMTYSTR